MTKQIYIAHPLFGDGSPEWGDTSKNVERYLRCVGDAVSQGCGVITWVHYWLTGERGLTEGDAQYYLDLDCALMDRADALWVYGPPEVSAGVRYEIAHAEGLGIPVHHKVLP